MDQGRVDWTTSPDQIGVAAALSRAEIRALEAYRRRRSIKGAAALIGLSTSTIEKHLAEARSKLRATSSADAVIRYFGEDGGKSASAFSSIPDPTPAAPIRSTATSFDAAEGPPSVRDRHAVPYESTVFPEPGRRRDPYLNLHERLTPAMVNALIVAGLCAAVLAVVVAILVLLSQLNVSFFHALDNLTL